MVKLSCQRVLEGCYDLLTQINNPLTWYRDSKSIQIHPAIRRDNIIISSCQSLLEGCNNLLLCDIGVAAQVQDEVDAGQGVGGALLLHHLDGVDEETQIVCEGAVPKQVVHLFN